MNDFVKRIKTVVNVDELSKNEAFYYKKRVTDYGNTNKLERAKNSTPLVFLLLLFLLTKEWHQL